MLINFLPNSDFLLIPGTKGSNLIEHVTNCKILRVFIAQENRQHLVMPPTASPWNDIWEMSVEIPCKSVLMTRHYPDLGSASDWSCCLWNLLQPIRNATQIWVVTRHQYGISVLVSQTSFHRETVGGIAKCCLFSQDRVFTDSDLKWNYQVKCKCYSFFINYSHDVDEGDNDDQGESADGGVDSDFNNKKYCRKIFNIFMK